jgi:hypothetical protein
MAKKREYTKEDFGDNFISFSEAKQERNGKLTKQVTLECKHCGKHFNASVYNALRIKQQCCSVSCNHRMKEKFPGGNEVHPLYSRWLSMTQRIRTPNSTNYKNYGGRGITKDPYFDSFDNYVYYLETLPNYDLEALKDRKLTVDRIDNDLGYVIGNLRLVSQSVQLCNQRKRATAFHSKYIGVTFSNIHQRWVATVTYKGKKLFSRTFTTEEAAVNARYNFIVENDLPNKAQKYVD